ncbi:hypothetical protein ACKFKG_32400 [Phormidesmis sp. 146-35]
MRGDQVLGLGDRLGEILGAIARFPIVIPTTISTIRTIAMNEESLLNRAALICPNPYDPAWERVLMLLISSPDGLSDTIRNLHARGFAEAATWSRPLPIPNSQEVMSVLSKRRMRDEG